MTESARQVLSAPPPIAICELGVLGVESGGHWATVRGPRSPVLLAAMGLAGQGGVRTDELIETIWPSPDRPVTARQSVANMVLRLRSSHGESFIESTQSGYRIGEHVQSDRARFLADVESGGELVGHAPDRALELADRALARWRSEPWVGIERPVGVEADRAYLWDMRIRARRVRARALIALNRDDSALMLLRELLVDDPFDEFARYQFVRLLTDAGQRAEAVRTIHDARRVFSERGLLLDAALLDVEQHLLSSAFMSDAVMRSLPEQATDFVGRAAEAEEIANELRSSRLVTLHGVGGSGKTRLAVHVAAEISEPGRCGFVDLVEARSSAQVELAFARGLGLPPNRLDGLNSDERREALVRAASASTGVVVVDNCEHVLSDVRAVVAGLLARPSRLRILATSRVPLEVAGERRFPIPEFVHGVELFRNRTSHHGGRVDPSGEAGAIAEVCDLVDRLPLAIEIAAAQTPYRTTREIADELKRGIEHRDPSQLEPRHETMSAAIRWSHELLEADVAAAFVRLGIFGAGFQHSDAAAVIGAGDVRGVLDTLVRSSLVERVNHEGRSTYRLLDPIRQYCAAELERSGESAEVGFSLAEWLLELTDRPYGEVWWRVSVVVDVAPRLSNGLAAVGALRAAGRTDEATVLAARLGGAARNHGSADELIDILTELWPVCGDVEAVADALVAIVLCSDTARRNEVSSHALDALDALDGPAGRRHRIFVHCSKSLWTMWAARLTDEDYQAADQELQLARSVEEGLDSPISRADIERWQSAIHLLAGDWPAAEVAARRALDDSAGTYFDVDATSCLCYARLHLGDPGMALDLASNHPDVDREASYYGNRLGIVGAIARVQLGDIDLGLIEIAQILGAARGNPVAVQQDDAAIAIGYIAHLVLHDDLALQILEAGVLGYGPWMGHLVPKMCRDLGIPLTGHYSRSVAERGSRSDHYGATASRVLDELLRRRTSDVG